MHTHPRTHTGTIALAAADARAGARKLVEYALRAGSLDNVGVIVVDLRHLFSQTVGAYSPAPTAPPAVDVLFRSMAEALLSRVDVFGLDDEHSGWLLKQSTGGFFGRRWQRRWFVCNCVQEDFSRDASSHTDTATKTFILHYHESPEKALSSNPSKVTFIDPMMGARLEPQLNKAGRVCLSLFEASTATPFVLAASSEEEANVWVGKLNDSFRRHGFTPAQSAISTLDTLAVARTLSILEVNTGKVGLADDGSPCDAVTAGDKTSQVNNPVVLPAAASPSLSRLEAALPQPESLNSPMVYTAREPK